MEYGKFKNDIKRIEKYREEGDLRRATLETERLQKKLDADWKRMNSFEGWFPELSGIPIFWLIIGIGVVIFSFATMLF